MPIDVDNVSFAYGGVVALRQVSAFASAGRITALIGPNASGKSTLLRCIIGSLQPQTGSIMIDGKRVSDFSTRQLAQRIAYVPQRSIVSAAFSVRQVIELGRYALPANARKVNLGLEQLDLTDIADRPYPKLSIGQQQRVTFARAVAQLNGDGHFILDEPTSAMDLRHIASCTRLLREIAEGGATVILALHDLSLAACVADDIWLMNEGRMLASGAVRDVMDISRLQSVFGVPFEWVNDASGKRLVAGFNPQHAIVS